MSPRHMGVRLMVALDRLKPANAREAWFLVAGALIGMALLLLLGARYSLIPAGGAEPVSWLLDHWTGAVTRCIATCGQ